MQLFGRWSAGISIACRFVFVIVVALLHGNNAQGNGYMNLLSGTNIVNSLRNVYSGGNTYPTGNNGYSYTYPISNSFNTMNGGGNTYVATMSPPAIVYNNNSPTTINR
jgi:hypothetical protein